MPYKLSPVFLKKINNSCKSLVALRIYFYNLDFLKFYDMGPRESRLNSASENVEKCIGSVQQI